jgi:hypothetical protein
MRSEQDSDWELIPDAEPPVSPIEFEQALAGKLSRRERRRLWRLIKDADMLVFHA